jgi:signal transduction histidine kinase
MTNLSQYRRVIRLSDQSRIKSPTVAVDVRCIMATMAEQFDPPLADAALPNLTPSTLDPDTSASGARPMRKIERSRPAAAQPIQRSDRSDLLRPFQVLIVIIRWICLFVSALLIATTPGEQTQHIAVVFAIIAAWTAFRTVRPIRNWGFNLGTATSVVIELAITSSAVCMTGYWGSPLTFMILPGVLIGGFSQGGPLVVGYGTITSLIITLTASLNGHQHSPEDWRSGGQWAIELMVVALVAGLGHRVLSETLERHSAALDSMQRLNTANSLLLSLHRVAQSLPESLDLDDVMRSTLANARELFNTDAAAILLHHDGPHSFLVGLADGMRIPATLHIDDFPCVGAAQQSQTPIRLDTLQISERATLSPDAQAGIYAPLRTRNALIGVLVLEFNDAKKATTDVVDLVRRFSEPAAVAIDNARWFNRIGTVAADEERIRIARDLHDRVGQSLAYIGFELDRLSKTAEGTPLAEQVTQLRSDVRGVVGEVRETLYDLRTEVDATKGLVGTLEDFLERVKVRSPLAVTFEHKQTGSLPSRAEREMWQIAKEAIVNVERHARATELNVRWFSSGAVSDLEIHDNGRGIDPRGGRTDSYGLRGLYERAGAIGAILEIHGEPGQGTTVRCRLETL